jgi:hypothetical protein
MPPAPNLTALANEAGSDKGDKIFHAHNYTPLYSFLFESFYRDNFEMLEIGLQRGVIDPEALKTRAGSDLPSIRMWLAYFPNAYVHGFDISDFSAFRFDRFSFIRGDLGSEADLEKLRHTLPRLRLAIDDGSHAAYHQQLAFMRLFEKIEPGGYYVIEDLHASHPIEQQLPKCRRTADVMDEFLRTGVFDIPFVPDHVRAYVASNIRKTFVHRNDKGGVNHWAMKLIAFEKR